MSEGALLTARGLGVTLSGRVVLKDVSLALSAGHLVALVGPNGAGKTTLLQVAGALLAPTRGTVELLGERFGEADLGELRTRVGLSSAALADRVPPHERAVDVVVTAAHGVLGRWAPAYDSADVDRAVDLLRRVGAGAVLGPWLSTGRLALTAYTLQIVFLALIQVAVGPRRDDSWLILGSTTLVVVGGCWLLERRFGTGPLEWVIHQLRPSSRPQGRHEATSSDGAGAG